MSKRNKVAIKCGHYDKLVWPKTLTPHPLNPYTHNQKQIDILCSAILKRGILWPIAVSSDTGYVISGHCRRLAGIQLGIKYPVVFRKYKNEVAAMLSDNKVAELSVKNSATLAEAFVMLDQYNYEIETTGYDTEEVQYHVNWPSLSGLFDPNASSGTEKNKEKVKICPSCQRNIYEAPDG